MNECVRSPGNGGGKTEKRGLEGAGSERELVRNVAKEDFRREAKEGRSGIEVKMCG